MSRTLNSSSPLLLALSLSVGLFTESVAGAAAQPSPKPLMELRELIRLYMIPTLAGRNGVSWETGSSASTAIVWEHAGTRDCDAYRQSEFGTSYCRAGSVVLTVHGKPSYHVLGTTIQPGTWKITLMGSRAGVDHVTIESDGISRDLHPALLQRAAESHEHGFNIASITRYGGETHDARLFSVESPKRQLAYIQEWYSCGSAGCSIRFILSFTKESAQRLMAPDSQVSSADTQSSEISRAPNAQAAVPSTGQTQRSNVANNEAAIVEAIRKLGAHWQALSQSPGVLMIRCRESTGVFRVRRLEEGAVVRVDVRKTNSIINPYLGIIQITGRFLNSPRCFETPEEARRQVTSIELASSAGPILDFEVYYVVEGNELVLSGGNEFFQNAFLLNLDPLLLEPNNPWRSVFRFPIT